MVVGSDEYPQGDALVTAKVPYVSVCLPVYNGEKYIREAIDSIRAQTFEDFEVIISDNASTDKTQEICRGYSNDDCRVKYFRAKVNQGLAWNWNRAFELASGRYLAWICHDDRLEPDYIGRCVDVLNRDETTVLCFANSEYIDANGQSIQCIDLANPALANEPSERFHQVLYDARCDPIYGLMRADVLRLTRLHGGYADSDRVLLAEMSLRGRFHKISEYLFARRLHPMQATAQADRWERTLIFDPKKEGTPLCPWLREFIDLVGAIYRAPISRGERFKAYKFLYWWARIYRSFLYRDALRGLKCAMGQNY
jgi:glycosyltransferase involved in cell wall biosynthesis